MDEGICVNGSVSHEQNQQKRSSNTIAPRTIEAAKMDNIGLAREWHVAARMTGKRSREGQSSPVPASASANTLELAGNGYHRPLFSSARALWATRAATDHKIDGRHRASNPWPEFPCQLHNHGLPHSRSRQMETMVCNTWDGPIFRTEEVFCYTTVGTAGRLVVDPTGWRLKMVECRSNGAASAADFPARLRFSAGGSGV